MTADALINFVYRAKNRAKEETRKVVGDLEKVRAKAEAIKKVGKQIAARGAIISAAVTGPAILAFNRLTAAATDLNETVSKTEAIFGQSAEALNSWAREAAEAMGLSTKAALDFASRFGGALKEIGGLSQIEAAKVAKELTQLSADLNSFFNRADAGDAIASALTGEFEPLKKFNVIVNEAILKQKALELGIYAGTGALSQQAKQAATLAVIMAQTSDAQGDFQKTASGAANASRILAAKQENLSANLGQKLLPLKLRLIELLTRLVDAANELSPEVQDLIIKTVGFAAAIGPLIVAVGGLIIVLGNLKVAIALVKVAMLRLGAVATVVWAQVLFPAAVLISLLGAVGIEMARLAGTYETTGKRMAEGLTPVQQSLVVIQKGLHFAQIGVLSLTTGFLALATAIAQIPKAVKESFEGIKLASFELANFMLETFTDAAKGIAILINDAVSGLVNGFEGLIDGLADSFEELINGMIDGLNTVTSLIPGATSLPSVSFPRSSIDAPQINISDLEAPRIQYEPKVFEDGDFTKTLRKIRDEHAEAVGFLLNNVPDGRDLLNQSQEAAEGFTEALQSGSVDALSEVDALGGGLDELQKKLGGGGGGGTGSGGSGGAGARLQAEVRESPLVREAKRIGEYMSLANVAAAGLQGTFEGISGSISGLINGTMTWASALQNVAASISGALIDSFSRMAAAWIIEQLAMGAVTQSVNAANAVSAAPAATLASIGSFGAAGIIGAAAVIAALAAVGGAFKEGGFTGNAGTSSVAGVVHGREFVNNASSTAMNREFLEHLNNGGSAAAVIGGAMEAGRGSNETTIIMVDSMAKAQRMSRGMKGEVKIIMREEMQRRRS